MHAMAHNIPELLQLHGEILYSSHSSREPFEKSLLISQRSSNPQARAYPERGSES